MEKIPCIYGHDITKYNRKDRRCGACHSERNRRYEATEKGRAKVERHETKRRRNPERVYYRAKWFIRTRIANKKQKLAELERMLT